MTQEQVNKYTSETFKEKHLHDAVESGELECIIVQAYDLNDIIDQIGGENIVTIIRNKYNNDVEVYALPDTLTTTTEEGVTRPLYKCITYLREFCSAKNAGCVRASVSGYLIDVA